MRGGIVGDVAGQPWEGGRAPPNGVALIQPKSCFTDDTAMLCACAEALLDGTTFKEAYLAWGNRFPDAGYGDIFSGWLQGRVQDGYGSLGNGAPMRAAPCGHLARTEREALDLAAESCSPTHTHVEAVVSARAVAAGIFAGRTGRPKEDLRFLCREHLEEEPPAYGDLIGGSYRTVRALPTTLAAFACALEAEDFGDCVRKAILLGGDTDTTASIAGALIEPWSPVPDSLWAQVAPRLDPAVSTLLERFEAAKGAGRIPRRTRNPLLLAWRRLRRP